MSTNINKKTIFYKKEGRKYVPVYEYDQELMDAFPHGSHLVICYPGGKSTRYNVDPNHAALIAASRVAEDAMTDALFKASEMQPKHRSVTEEQRQAWTNLQRAFGDDMFALHTESARGIAEAGVQALQAEADKLMQHKSVKHAYEHFLLTCKLCMEHQNGT